MHDGEVEQRDDILTPALAARFAATFDRPARDTAPQGIHWCLTTPETPTDALGGDGHPLRVDADALPRRMWASSATAFHAPIPVGAVIQRRSHVAERTEKAGRTGRLVFVTIAHEIFANGRPAVTERQSVVYRAAPEPGAPAAAVEPGPLLPDGPWDWERSVTPQPPLLFRYSALTFNSHRIHYDLPYAQGVEGYAGLVVHGPLLASLLLDLVDRSVGPDALSHFAFRALRPAFAGAPLRLLGRRTGAGDVLLAVADAMGGMFMSATATFK